MTRKILKPGERDEICRIKSSDVALEIGCGVGRVGKVLSERVTTWIGTDISRNMLAWAPHN